MPGCVTCLSESWCLQCVVFYLDTTTGSCVEECNSPTEIMDDDSYTCLKCNEVLEECNECTSDGLECTKCSDNYPYL